MPVVAWRLPRDLAKDAIQKRSSGPTFTEIAVRLSKVWLGVVEAASDDPRIQRDHRGGGKHNYIFHILAG